MEFQGEGCWGARRMWCFIAWVEYRGIIILLDLEIKKKIKKYYYICCGTLVRSVWPFSRQNHLIISKKKKTTPQAWFGIFKLNVHQDASWHIWIKFEIFLSNASGLFRKKLGYFAKCHLRNPDKIWVWRQRPKECSDTQSRYQTKASYQLH